MRNNTMRLLSGIFPMLFVLISAFSATTLQAQASWGDYSLYSPQNSNKVYLLDMTGSIYKTWTFATNQRTAYGVYMLPGGTIIRSVSGTNTAFNGAACMSTSIQKADYNGTVLWTYTHSSTTYVMHHDICPMPNGNVLAIAYELKTAAEVQQAGCSLNSSMWSEKIIEIEPVGTTGGNIVWEWHLWDHLCQNYNATKDNYVTSIVNNPQLLNVNYLPKKDWIHMNGVDYNAELDQITFSSHYMNEIYVIDHSTTTAEAAGHTGGKSGKGGDFLYRWGNPAAYGATGTKIFNIVHDAHWVPYDCPKGGYLSAFNNQGGTGNKSCVDVINPPLNGNLYTHNPGSAFAPATYDWRHVYSGNATSNMGSAQQLPNGNTYICIALSGYLYEIDSNQIVVWSKSVGTSIPKSFRYSAAYVNNTLGQDEQVAQPAGVRSWPNPTTGVLHITGWREGTVVLITDIHGKTTQHRIINQVINLTGYPQGLYLLRNADAPGTGALRVVIQK